MKIVDRKTFLSMPEGTVFSKYKPCLFDGLCVKASSLEDFPNDFLYDELVCPVYEGEDEAFSGLLFVAEEKGTSVPLTFSEATIRDGMFDEDQLFAIYELPDLTSLIFRLIDARIKLSGHG